MASNIEGQSLRSMSSATAKPGGISGVVKALFADRMLGRGGGSGGKSGIDYHNEELARQKEFSRETQRSDYVLQHMDKRKDFTDMNRSTTGFSARRRIVSNTSSGGQGTRSTTRSKQQQGVGTTSTAKPAPKKPAAPRTPRTPKPTGPGELLV